MTIEYFCSVSVFYLILRALHIMGCKNIYLGSIENMYLKGDNNE